MMDEKEFTRWLAREVGGVVIPASGGLDGWKGDIEVGEFKLELKVMRGNRVSISRDVIKKIKREAFRESKRWGVAVELDGECYVLIGLDEFKRLLAPVDRKDG